MHFFKALPNFFVASVLLTVLATSHGACAATGRPLGVDGGQEVKIFQVPYLVQLRDESNNKLFCAGTLVSPQYVVTSASCFDALDYTKAVVVAGAATTTDEGEQRKIARLNQHPEYSPETKQANAAVLQLDQPLQIGRNIRPITLCNDAVAEGELVQTPGWGRMGNTDPPGDNVRSARIPVTSQNKCDTAGEKKLFCVTGHPGLAHCVGDSGGPAIYRGKLCGIVALSDKCSQPGESSGFTNILEVKTFLESVLK